ncbi:MAG: nicotinate-nucleotide--dimethylbenzimidazole phosphoribosyltransferase, partial [Eubacterium sp.]|nr:nicotinate-nucleotide--dimethylbenzimidazole phosphoribosyltransferase [Eubacterium sp.]
DNGVVAEGVTQTGQEVTANVAENFLTGNATASILCKRAGTDHFPVDIGMAKRTSVPDRRIAAGTQDLLYGPAMTRAQAVQGIVTGIGIAEELAQKGYRILAAGEMGIGNTTTSSAMASVLLDKDPEEVTGRGAGLDSQGLARKIEVIRESLRVNHPDPADPIDILACEGGFDIAGMTGLFLGGAACRVPVVCDGFISAVAALTAVRICREAAGYVFASHLSEEPAAAMILEALHKQAPIRCGMHLGEGTGAVMLFPLLDMALDVYHGMPTFADIEIEQYKELK